MRQVFGSPLRFAFSIAALAALITLFMLGEPVVAPEIAKPEEPRSTGTLSQPLYFTPGFIDMGVVRKSLGPAETILELAAPAYGAPVIIENVYTSCGCLSARLVSDKGEWGPFDKESGRIPAADRPVIAPGTSVALIVRLDPGELPVTGETAIDRVVTLADEHGYIIHAKVRARIAE